MTLRIPNHVVFEILDGQAVLLNLDSGNYHSLNSTATRVWRSIESGMNTDNIEASIADEFDVDPAVVQQDVRSVIDELIERGLLVREPS